MMSNPWLTENQYMSTWLSCFNQMTGHCATQAVPQMNATATKTPQDNQEVSSNISKPSLAKSKVKAKTKAKTKPNIKR